LVGVVDQSLSEEEMLAGLKADLDRAGEIIGVKDNFLLGYPDAGKYDYFDVRRDIIQHIRAIRPDFVITCDPWMPYEFHNDHILAGKAAASASCLYGLLRLQTDPAVDAAYEPFELGGIAFYGSAYPNTVVNITDVWQKKYDAIDQYRMQFSAEEMEMVLHRIEMMARQAAADSDADFTHAETMKVMYDWQLHGFPDAWKV
jgi:LmbE family N-acetylglucosaminyl deacetylase